jgi:NADH-quinone oxidoreductase subunit L
MTAFYMFRLYATTFRGTFRGTTEQADHLHESPWQMTLPLIILSVAAILAGFMGIPELFMKDAHWLQHFLSPVFAQSAALQHTHSISHSTEYILLGVSIMAIIIAIAYAWKKFSAKPDLENASGAAKMLANKWYIDELYDLLITRPLNQLSGWLNAVMEKKGIDGLVNGSGRMVQWGGRQLRLLQSGQVGGYLLWMVLGLIILLVIIKTI